MVEKKIKNLFSIFVFFTLFYSSSLQSLENNIYIVLKIENEIVTNQDIENEYNYLRALNNDLNKIKKSKGLKIAKNSIIREKIKEIELNKYYDLSVKNEFVENIVLNLFKKINLNTTEDINQYLSRYGVNLKDVKKKINIETTWNNLIYSKYKDQVNIDIDKLKKKIRNSKKIENSYLISEIFFTIQNKKDKEEIIKEIYDSINEKGFKLSATIYSRTDTSKVGGLIGWVNEKEISESITNKIKSLKNGEYTQPIQMPGGFLIIQVNDKKEKKITIDFEKELDFLIKKETNKILNQFSSIYYQKIRKNINLNES